MHTQCLYTACLSKSFLLYTFFDKNFPPQQEMDYNPYYTCLNFKNKTGSETNWQRKFLSPADILYSEKKNLRPSEETLLVLIDFTWKVHQYCGDSLQFKSKIDYPNGYMRSIPWWGTQKRKESIWSHLFFTVQKIKKKKWCQWACPIVSELVFLGSKNDSNELSQRPNNILEVTKKQHLEVYSLTFHIQ